MPSFKELIATKSKRLEDIPLKLQTLIQKQQQEVLNGIIEKLNGLSLKNGAYEISPANIKVIGEISEELRSVFLNEDYLKGVRQFASEFDKQAIINDALIKTGFGSVENSIASKLYIQNAKKSAIEALAGGAIDTQFVKPLQGILENSVVNGASFKETLSSITEFVKGNEKVDSRILKYAKQITNDSFAIADRSYTSLVSEALGTEWFYFSGSEVNTTRCFCQQRVGNYYHYLEIESWGNGENLGECNIGNGLWAGEIPGTNSATIYSYLGGYNCMHSLMPVSIDIVPESDIQRAKQLGFID
ncbi:MAG: hypothetical protein V4608_10965 [Bacteroidota bacterium]